MSVRIKDLTAGTPSSTDAFAFDGSDGTKKVAFGDLGFQPKTDSSLTTTAQTVVGAINEHEEDITILNTYKAAKTQLSNRNLLDNPWFTVNQRGFTTGAVSGGTYTVDRWLGVSTLQTITANANGINVSVTSAYGAGIGQRLESDRITVGETYTISLLKQDGTILSATFVAGTNWVVLLSDTNNFGIIMGFESTSSVWKIHLVTTTTATVSVDIRAVKLELGSVSTLAMDTAPNYTEELLKCQRYFTKVDTRVLGTYYTNSTSIYFIIPIAVPMRTTPSITGLSIDVVGEGAITFSTSAATTYKNNIALNVSGASITFTGRATYEALLSCMFSADL